MNIKIYLRPKIFIGVSLIGLSIYMLIAQTYRWIYGDVRVFSGSLGLDVFLVIFALFLPLSFLYVGFHLFRSGLRIRVIEEQSVQEKKSKKMLIYPWIVILLPLLFTPLLANVDQGGWVIIFYFVYLIISLPFALFSTVSKKSVSLSINYLVSISSFLFIVLFLYYALDLLF